jgi:MFS family permease
MPGQLRRNRYAVVGLLVFLFAITYIDRVCISVAGPRMQADLHIDPIGWGWVTGLFTLGYGLFEIPTGALADKWGPRRVLTRIVLWWSAFTAFTGAATGYRPLLLTRFLFGAGEAGALPSSSVVVARWFPPAQRATMSGVCLMAGQVGGALAPLLVVPIQSRYGWRMSFFVFGGVGVVWAAVWYAWFRDTPAGTDTMGSPAAHVPFPWRAAFRSRSVLAMLGMAACYVYAYNFFQTWFHTFLVKGRAFDEGSLSLSALPYVLAAVANLGGGMMSDALVRKWGVKNGRRVPGAAALAFAGLMTIAAMLTRGQMPTVILLSLVYASITFQQSTVFGTCMDIGRRHAGSMVGFMNTSAQAGGLLGSVAYGYLVDRFHSYDAPFLPMAGLLFLGALFWTKIDASTDLGVVTANMP